ncbi:LysE family translocator [Desulfovibrio oxamicus]|uniref:LysE family translocator n=1 Tax=Nitratidesulfovibrio oxamicus TaxID=32016 RepID=A0ABS0J0U4_9BACT|nr:LysE family translocator [Nitratidesulfovibrio oxamicus]MBG3876025.1 LysE family translocator [Nitratidesulfovibrio oxamicus]
MNHEFLAFLGLAALLVVTPGPDTMLVVRNSLRVGARGGVATTLGCVSGLLVHVVCSGLGVSAVLVHSAGAFHVVRLVGAAYLVWLGVRALHGAWKGGPDAPVAPIAHDAPSAPDACETPGTVPPGPAQWRAYRAATRGMVRRAWVEGFLSNVLNPKVAVFYLAVLPNVVAAGGMAGADGGSGAAMLGGAFVRACLFGGMQAVVAVLWFSFLSVSVHRARATLLRPGVQRTLEGGVGGLMVGFGLRLALDRG